jgi:outer membrane scaffolding protein for murein synthesis (MipA/OmpV family)
LGGHWYLDAYLRHTSLDREITDSPLIDRSHSQSALLALAYRF